MKTITALATAAGLALTWNATAAPIHDTVATGTPSEVHEALAAGADANERDAAGHTPLHHAAVRYEMPRIVRTLLDAGADPHARASDGSTALHYAVGAARHLAVRELLIAGADPNARNNDNDTPLHYLAAGWAPTPGAGVDGLAALAAIAGPAATGTRTGQTTGLIAGAFALAGFAHNRKKIGWTVRQLTTAGVDLDARNNAGETPIQLARRLGNTHQAKYMGGSTIAKEDLVAAVEAKDPEAAADAIDRGARPTARELVRAAALAHPELVNLILGAGVAPGASYDSPVSGWTALHAVADRPYRWKGETEDERDQDMSRRIKIAQRLILKGADPLVPSGSGITPLQKASGFGLTELATLFRGPLTSPLIDLATQFEHALTHQDLAWIHHLLADGFDPTALDSEGRTAICRAIMQGARRIIDALHAGGADLRARNADGKTTFHCLVLRKTYNYGSLGMLLLKNDVPLDAEDDAGRDTLEFAIHMNNPDMARFARNYGPGQLAKRPKPNRTFLQ